MGFHLFTFRYLIHLKYYSNILFYKKPFINSDTLFLREVCENFLFSVDLSVFHSISINFCFINFVVKLLGTSRSRSLKLVLKFFMII